MPCLTKLLVPRNRVSHVLTLFLCDLRPLLKLFDKTLYSFDFRLTINGIITVMFSLPVFVNPKPNFYLRFLICKYSRLNTLSCIHVNFEYPTLILLLILHPNIV